MGAVFIALYHASCTLKGYFNRLRIFFVVALFALITPTLEKCAHPIGETYIPRLVSCCWVFVADPPY